MPIRTGPVWVISFALLAACGTLCQNRPSADWLQALQIDNSNPPEVQRNEMAAAALLPDAPSTVQPPRHDERFRTLVNAADLPSTASAIGVGAMHETKLGFFVPGPQRNLAAPYQVVFVQNQPNAFLGKYFYSGSLQRDTRYYASTSDSFMGRASYAASSIFVARDSSGTARLNTRYLLGVLSSVAMHAAYRPYRARSASETFNNFGSTIGGDAGMNVFHEFRPGIRQLLKGLTPKFASRIADRIPGNQIPK